MLTLGLLLALVFLWWSSRPPVQRSPKLAIINSSGDVFCPDCAYHGPPQEFQFGKSHTCPNCSTYYYIQRKGQGVTPIAVIAYVEPDYVGRCPKCRIESTYCGQGPQYPYCGRCYSSYIVPSTSDAVVLLVFFRMHRRLGLLWSCVAVLAFVLGYLTRPYLP